MAGCQAPGRPRHLNWLAHVVLSPDDATWQLGNLLADNIPRKDRSGLAHAMQCGIALHQAIDKFTDAHPLVKAAHAALPLHLRRYAGPVVDVYYDHLLATRWTRFHAQPLRGFIDDFFRRAQACATRLPEPAQQVWQRIVAHDVLAAYTQLETVQFALQRIAQRWKTQFGRDIALTDSIAALETQRSQLETGFDTFFPLLQAHAREVSANLTALTLTART
jgi:acyl carrier protein phosphodiesterase